MVVDKNLMKENSSKAIRLANAILLDVSNKTACDYVNTVYKNCDKRGMYKTIKKQAVAASLLAFENGLTAENPVVERDGVFYGIVFGLDPVVPLYRKEILK